MLPNNKLPDKLSELLDIALFSLETVERSVNKYLKINLNIWHEFRDGVCTLCLAGCVMKHVLKIKDTQTAFPFSFDEDTCIKLKAISFCAFGQVDSALCLLNSKQIKTYNKNIVDYNKNKKEFKSQLKKLIYILQKDNL